MRWISIARAEDGDRDGEQQSETFLPAGRLDDAHELFADELGRVPRHHARQRLDILCYRLRIGDEAVGQHGGAEQRHQCEKGVEGDAGCNQPNIVLG